MQKTVVADSVKSTRKDMTEDPAQKLDAGQSLGSTDLGLPVGIAEGHKSILFEKDIRLADDSSVKVSRKVAESLLSLTDMAAVHDPLFRHVARNLESSPLEVMIELATEDLGHRGLMEEVVSRSLFPSIASCLDPS